MFNFFKLLGSLTFNGSGAAGAGAGSPGAPDAGAGGSGGGQGAPVVNPAPDAGAAGAGAGSPGAPDPGAGSLGVVDPGAGSPSVVNPIASPVSTPPSNDPLADLNIDPSQLGALEKALDGQVPEATQLAGVKVSETTQLAPSVLAWVMMGIIIGLFVFLFVGTIILEIVRSKRK